MEEVLAGSAGLAVGAKEGKDPGTHLGFELKQLAEQCHQHTQGLNFRRHSISFHGINQLLIHCDIMNTTLPLRVPAENKWHIQKG